MDRFLNWKRLETNNIFEQRKWGCGYIRHNKVINYNTNERKGRNVLLL